MLQSQVFADLAKKGLISPILCFSQAFKTTSDILLLALCMCQGNINLAVKMAHDKAKQTAEVLHVPHLLE